MDREVLLEHAAFLRRLAQSLLHDAHGAEDVVQETYLAALRRPPPDPGRPRAWLARIARNLALTTRRARMRRERRERRSAPRGSSPPVDEAVARLEVQRRVVDAVIALEEPYRSAVIHRFFYGRSLKECAHVLGVPVPTVRTRLARALDRLRGRLDREHGGDRQAWSIALLTALPQRRAVDVGGGALLLAAKLKIAAAVLLAGGISWFLVEPGSRDEGRPRTGANRHAAATVPEAQPDEPDEPGPGRTAPDRDRDVFGIVVDPEGTAVAGARVRGIVHPGRRVGATRELTGLARDRGSTRTRVDGTFRMRLERGEIVTLRAEADGFPPIEMDQVQAGEKVRLVLGYPTTLRVVVRRRPLEIAVEDGPVDFPLRRGCVASGRLVDGERNPIEGALVWAGGTDHRHKRSERHTRSDADGRFVLRGLHPELPHTLVVLADGFGRTVFDFPAGDFDFGEITLPAGQSIEGRLVGADGKPVPRTLVELKGANGDRGRLLGTRLPVRYGSVEQRHTDDLGRFRFPDLAPGRYLLRARRGRSAPDAAREVKLTSHDILDADLSWAPTRDFHVHVRDEEGRPLPRVFVHVDRQVAVTDSTGVARFRIERDVKRISVNASSSRRAPPFLAPPPVQDPPPGLGEYRITVLRAGEARGRAVDASDHPLRHTSLEARRDGELLDAITTDEEGNFTAKVPVSRDAYLVLTGGLEGRLSGVRAGANDLILRATADSSQVRLRVMDPAGRPVPGLLVRAARTTGRTDAEGRVSLAAPRGKEVTVEVWLSPQRKSKHKWVPPSRRKVVGGGEEVVLSMRRGVPIRGTVERPHGKDAGGAVVVAYLGEKRIAHTNPDESGRFVLIVPADEPGAFRLRATDGKWRSGDFEATAGATDVRLSLDQRR